MHSQEAIDRGNNAVVFGRAEQQLADFQAVTINYLGLHAMDTKGHKTEVDAITDAEAYVQREGVVGGWAKVLTRQGVREIRNVH